MMSSFVEGKTIKLIAKDPFAWAEYNMRQLSRCVVAPSRRRAVARCSAYSLSWRLSAVSLLLRRI